MELVQRRDRAMPGDRSTIRVLPWPSPEAEEALASLPERGRPKAMAGRIVAQLPSGVVLPRCDRDVMELVYEMEGLARAQPPSEKAAQPAESGVQASASTGSDSNSGRKDGSPRGDTLSTATATDEKTARSWREQPDAVQVVAASLEGDGFAVLDGFLDEAVAESLLLGMEGERCDTGGRSTEANGGYLVKLAGEGQPMPGHDALIEATDALVQQLRDSSDVAERLRFVEFASKAQFSIGARDAPRRAPNADSVLDVHGRRLTAILFLNRKWEAEADGGQLRFLGPDSVQVKADIAPSWNRLVVFWSDAQVPHEVLPAQRDGFSVSVGYVCARQCLGHPEALAGLFEESRPLRALGAAAGAGPRLPPLVRAAANDEQRRALLTVPWDDEARAAHLRSRHARLAELFSWPPPAQEDGSFDPAARNAVKETVRRTRDVECVHVTDSARWQQLCQEGRPLRVLGAHASGDGAKVLEFMSTLLRVAGREEFVCERQVRGRAPEASRLQLSALMHESHAAAGGGGIAAGDAAAAESGAFLACSPCELLAEPALAASLGEQLPPLLLDEGARHAPRWLVLSGGAAMSSLRRSSTASCSWSALILGNATWRLVPPTSEGDPTGLHGIDGDGESGISAFDGTADKVLPAGVEVWETTQGPGEILLIPPGWWHQARFQGCRTLSVTEQQRAPLLIDGPVQAEAAANEPAARSQQLHEEGRGQHTPAAAQESPGELSESVREAMDVLLGAATPSPQEGGGSGHLAQPSILNDGGVHGSGQLMDEEAWCALYINLSRRPDRLGAMMHCVAGASASLQEKLERIDAVDGKLLSLDDAAVREVVSEAALERARRAQARGTHTIVHQAGQLLHFDDHLTLGAIGCAMSHRLALRAIAAHPSAGWGLVLEDDITGVAAGVEERMAALLGTLPHDWDAVFLGYHDTVSSLHADADRQGGTRDLVPVRALTAPLYGLYAWMVRKEAAALLLDHVFPIDGQVDYAISRWLSRERPGRSFVVDPAHMLFYSPKSEVGNDSDIQTMATLEAVIQECGSLGDYFSKLA